MTVKETREKLDVVFRELGISVGWTDFILYVTQLHPNELLDKVMVENGAPIRAQIVRRQVTFGRSREESA